MAEQKTIGQIAYDVMRERYPERLPPWGTDHVVCEDYEAAASAVWDQAVTDCIARIDEEIESLQEGLMTDAGLSKQDEIMMNAQIAAFIDLKEIYRSRSLKRSDKTESGDA